MSFKAVLSTTAVAACFATYCLMATTATAADAVSDQGTPSVQAADQGSLTGQGADQGAASLQEVVVTAEKREELAINVPMSIVPVSAEELQQREVASIDDLQFAVPGISETSTGWQRRMYLQGVVNSSGIWQTMGMYLDDADVTTSIPDVAAIGVYDLQRVEVLRGPQGTLYGEGSEGGTIRFITNAPNLQSVDASSDLTALFTQDGAPSQRINAMLNVPLIDDQLAFRIAGLFDHEGGWIDQPGADRKNFNSSNLSDVRARIRWLPVTNLVVDATANVHRNATSIDQGEDPAGNYTQVYNLQTTPAVEDDFDIYNLHVNYEGNFARVVSSTSYIYQDTKATDFGYFLNFGPGADYAVYQNPYEQINRATTEELRVQSVGDGRFQWSMGGDARDAHFDVDQDYAFSLVGTPPVYYPNNTFAVSRSWAGFADVNFAVTSDLTVGAGARYFRDDQSYLAASLGASPTYQTGTFSNTDPRFYVRYHLTESNSMYANVAKGFRSGGFNSIGEPAYQPESLWNYEIGDKALLFDRRLSLDAAVFYSQYTGYQITAVTNTTNPINGIFNAGKVDIKGLELNLDWQPNEHWDLSARLDHLQSTFGAGYIAYNAGTEPGEGLGNPSYTATASIERRFQIASRQSFVRIDYSQIGLPIGNVVDNANPFPDEAQKVIHMLNGHFGEYISARTRIGIFIENALNQRGIMAPVDVGNYGVRPRPRTLGIEMASSLQ